MKNQRKFAKKTRQEPVISVIMPAFNEELHIEKSLRRLREQNFSKPYEIIVVNGPSTDRTKEIAEKYANIVVDQTGFGIGQARHQGCRLASGQILAMTDADVFVPANWLTLIDNFFHQNPEAVAVTGPYQFINSDHLNRAARIVRPVATALHTWVAGGAPLSGTNTAVRNKAYYEAGEFDPEITGLEDVELGNRLLKIGKVVYAADLVVETTDRRYRKPLQHIFTTALPAYVKRMIFKTKDKKVIWEKVED